MSKQKTKKKKIVVEREEDKPKAPEPFIDPDLLQAFLDRKLTPQESTKVTNIYSGFLWEKFGCERYRINAWGADLKPGSFCKTHLILASFFLHYNRETETLEDITIQTKSQKRKK